MGETKNSVELLNEILSIEGVEGALIIGLDGFIVESKGTNETVNLDALGASIAKSFSGIVGMGTEMKVGHFKNLYIEYENTMILGFPVDDLLVAIIAPEHGRLASIRFKLKKVMPESLDFA